MADARPFAVYDSTGAPVTGAAGGMSALAWDIAGASRTPPAVVELGAGLYQVTPTDADETAGTLVLVDTGAGHEPRRVAIACFEADSSNQFFGWHLEDSAGALWAGAAPTFGAWDDAAGTPRTPPDVVKVSAGVYVAVPSAADVTADCAGRIDSPAGAAPPYLSVATEPSSPWAAPSPGPLRDAAADVAAFLDGKTAGDVLLALASNLFIGPMRSSDRTSSPLVACLGTGGPGPDSYLGGRRTALYRPTVQVMVRGPAGDNQAGEALARGVLALLHQTTPAGYVTWLARDSAPAYLGLGADQHGLWSLNVECVYRVSLVS